MDGAITWVINGLLPGVVLTGIVWVASALWAKTGERRRWRLSQPDSLQIGIAQSGTVTTDDYRQPATGIGQAIALTIITPSLVRGWRDIDPQRVAFPAQIQGHSLETDLILIGGPLSNSLTAEVLSSLSDSLPVRHVGSNIVTDKKETFAPTIAENRVTVDYGLVIRTENPFCAPKRLIVLSGCTTYGVVAAARFASQSPEFKSAERDCAFVVKSVVHNGHALPPTVSWKSAL